MAAVVPLGVLSRKARSCPMMALPRSVTGPSPRQCPAVKAMCIAGSTQARVADVVVLVDLHAGEHQRRFGTCGRRPREREGRGRG